MKRMARAACLLLMVLPAACRSEPPAETAWIPTLENAGFEYLAETAEKAEEAVRLARQELAGSASRQVAEHLDRAETELLILRRYDIPMTEVRQSVYDAERFFALQMFDEVRENLGRADRVLAGIGLSGNSLVLQEIDKVRLQISEIKLEIEALQGEPAAQAPTVETVGEALLDLGNRINLMTMKADLVLSGTDFGEPR